MIAQVYAMFGDHDLNALKSAWGVYAIVNKRTGRQYIGGTGDSFLTRWKGHWYKLQSGIADNRALQWDWLFLGPDAFDFRILESFSGHPRSWREARDTRAWALHREAVYIAQSKNIYNVTMPSSAMVAGERAQHVASRLWEAFYGSPPPLNPNHDWRVRINSRPNLT